MSCTAPSFSLQRPDSRDANQLNDPVIVVCFRYPSSDTINLLQYVLFVTGVDGGGAGGCPTAHKLLWLFIMSMGHLFTHGAPPPLHRLFSLPHSVCIVLPFCLDSR